MEIKARLLLKNNRLLKARQATGLSMRDFSDFIGVPSTTYANIENLRPISPGFSQLGNYLEKIASALGLDINYLFPPEYISTLSAGKLPNARELTRITNMALELLAPRDPANFMLPEDIAANHLLVDDLGKFIDELPPKEARVLKMHFGLDDTEPHTLEQIASEFGVSREWIRQLESQALSRLRHPVTRRKLREYLD